MPLVWLFVIAYNYQRFNCCTCSNSLKRNTTYLRCANGNNSNNANGIRYSLNGTLYQASNTFSRTPNNYTLYVRNIADPSCMAISASATKINTPLPPVVPTVASLTQPSCAMPSGALYSNSIRVEYSLNGTTYQTLNSFSGLVPNNYVLYVRNVADNSCVAKCFKY
jgi:archaellum component FlaG (FlaF/FlaG flagellin family)